MRGYGLFQKGKKKLIKIGMFDDDGDYVDVLVFATKKGLLSSIDIEDDEEIRAIDKLEEVF